MCSSEITGRWGADLPAMRTYRTVRTAEEILLEAGASIGKTADDNGGGELKIVEDRRSVYT